MAFLNETGLEQVWGKIKTKVSSIENTIDDINEAKVDKVSGKGLSTNDYTTVEKEKLAGIAAGATKVIVDNTLSSTSENAIQNKVVANMKSDIDDILNTKLDTITTSGDGNIITDISKSGTTINAEKNAFATTVKEGNPVSEIGIAGTGFSVKTTFEPKQEGSGDPSPSNIRPISGWTGATLNHTNDSGLEHTYTADFGQTVYGGTLDWNTGVLTVDRALYTFNGSEGLTSGGWNNPYSYVLWGFLPNVAHCGMSEVADAYCSHYIVRSIGDVITNAIAGFGIFDSGNLIFSSPTHADVDAFKAYLAAQHAAGTPVQVCYKLATPTTIQLTPYDLYMLDGINNVYSDGNTNYVIFNSGASSLAQVDKNYLKLSGGTINGSIAVVSEGFRITELTGSSIKLRQTIPDSPWATGLSLISSDNSKELGCYGFIKNAGDNLGYYYIGNEYDAPQFKMTPDGTITLAKALPVTSGGTGATTASGARTNLEVPSKTGDGASGTWQINIGGTATSISYPTPILSTGCELNEITVKTNGNGSLGSNNLAIRSALDFRWYDTNWQVGNLRGGGQDSAGFGFSYSNDGGSTYALKSYIDTNGNYSGNASTATKLATPRSIYIGQIGIPFDGSSDIGYALSDIMGRARCSGSQEAYVSKYTKFARVNISNGPYDGVMGIFSFVPAEGNSFNGLLGYHIRNGSTISAASIVLEWLTISNANCAELVYAVKVQDGIFDLYYKPLHGWDTMTITNINSTPENKITFYSNQGYVDSINAVAVSSLGGQVSYASTANTLSTARTLTIGNTGKSFDGSGNVSWSLSEIGAAASSHTHSYLPLSGGTMSGKLTLNTSVTNHGNPLEQILCINCSGIPSGTTLTDKNSPGIGFHITNNSWGSLIFNNNAFKFIDSSATGYMPVYASAFYGSGANLTSLNASNITSGTLAVGKGGTGSTSKSGARTNLGITSGTSLPSASGYSAGDIFILY